jgi:ParB family transcriptional regulator, chromosome partitioning protein
MNENRQFASIALDLIRPNPEQPRQIFDREKLEELAQSIREHGVIEAITIEPYGDSFILHGGERRTIAARMAGLTHIPAIICEPLNGTGPRTRLERALVENVQRESMTPVEEARAYRRLRDEFGLKVSDIAKKIGKSTTQITGRLAITDLEPEIQALIEQGLLSHFPDAVKAMLTLPAGPTRIKFCTAMAQRKPTIAIIVGACKKFLESRISQEFEKKSGRDFTSPAVEIATVNYPVKRPDWDALKQVGALPQWSAIRETATATCDACALRSVASDANCRDCPLVDCIRRLIQAAHANAKR